MQFSRVALGLVLLAMVVDSTFIEGTVGVGAAYGGVALAGVVGLALGAGLVGLIAARRGKRSVEGILKRDMVLDMVAAADVYGCALKLTCLVEAKPEDQLSAEDQLILQLFGRSPAAITEAEVTTGKQAYFYAAYLGSQQGKDACEKVFHTCDVNYGTMIAYVQTLNA